ncbi:MAG: hypothetical protein HUN05_22335 [Desulfobacter sp.]|nr:MAG: hypothetical protein HUN05_22335 [Desulfobacter sp.]
MIILISQIVKTFIVAIFIYLLFHFFVIRHLLVIDKYLKVYEIGKSSSDLDLNRKETLAGDELDQVVSSINESSKKLKDSYEFLEHKVQERTKDLQDALEQVKTLNGLLPICCHCKKIRDDKGYWTHLESYIEQYSDASFSHGMCPECSEKLYGNETWYIEMKKDEKS